MTARPQNTAQNHPKSPEFTLLGAFEDEGVIQQSNYRRTPAPAPAHAEHSLSAGVAQVDALIRLLEARKAGSTAAQAAAISRLRRTLLPLRRRELRSTLFPDRTHQGSTR
jgi:hypothetical protein